MIGSHILKWLVPIVIVSGGVLVGKMLIAIAPTATRQADMSRPPMVEVITSKLEATAIKIRATGTVEPAVSIDLVPEVSGRVAWRSKKLTPGGRFATGELIARIEATQYQLAVAQERARVRSAQLELELEKSRGEVAAAEWKLLKGNRPNANPLVLRTSQLETAQVSLQAARSGLSRARLDLKRTRLEAPFNATVINESLDVGQRVAPGQSVAKLVGTDEFWVRVGLRIEDLQHFDIPGVNADQGSQVQVSQRLADGTRLVRKGQVIRLVDALDTLTRRAQVLISVQEPLAPALGLPLLCGAYVEVEIEGHVTEGLTAIPERALQEGTGVWLANDGVLARRTVRPRFTDEGQVFVSGLPAGAEVVVTSLSNPITGMAVERTAAAVPKE